MPKPQLLQERQGLTAFGQSGAFNFQYDVFISNYLWLRKSKPTSDLMSIKLCRCWSDVSTGFKSCLQGNLNSDNKLHKLLSGIGLTYW